MLYIIGLSHFAQSRKPLLERTSEQKIFTDLLKQTIDEVCPIFIGEENSSENLVNRNEISIAKEVADERKIEHRFCDPDQSCRDLMGYISGAEIFQFITLTHDAPTDREARLKGLAIEMGRYFPVRERYWLDGLYGCRDHSAIFICGYGHLIDSFLGLLKREDIAYEVIRSDVGVTEEERKDVLEIAKYLRDHSDLNSWNHRSFPRPKFISR